MGRTRHDRSSLTLGDFVVKRGLRTRQKKLKWKKRDSQRKGRSSAAQRRHSKKKYRALEQLVVAQEIEDYDRKREREARLLAKQSQSTSKHTPQDRVMADVLNTVGRRGRGSQPQDQATPPFSPSPSSIDMKAAAARAVVSEDAFRARILGSVLHTLFPPQDEQRAAAAVLREEGAAKEAGGEAAKPETEPEPVVVLDELDQISMRRIVESAIFWKARRQPFCYSEVYWFVPNEGAAECFVTARAVTRLFEELMQAEEPLERGLRVMLLKAIHFALPLLRHAVLRSLHEWASALHQQSQRSQACTHVPGGTSSGAKGQGLVELWAALVGRCSKAAAGAAGEEVSPSFTDPAVLLSRALGSFLKSPQVLVPYGDILVAAAVQLVQWRPTLGHPLVAQLLAKWPRRDSARELCSVRLLGALLGALSPEMVFRPQAGFGCNVNVTAGSSAGGGGARRDVLVELSKRLPLLVQSPQAKVSLETIGMLSNMYIFLRYVVAHPVLATQVSQALVATRSHWSTHVRESADKLFDQMLDYA